MLNHSSTSLRLGNRNSLAPLFLLSVQTSLALRSSFDRFFHPPSAVSLPSSLFSNSLSAIPHFSSVACTALNSESQSNASRVGCEFRDNILSTSQVWSVSSNNVTFINCTFTNFTTSGYPLDLTDCALQMSGCTATACPVLLDVRGAINNSQIISSTFDVPSRSTAGAFIAIERGQFTLHDVSFQSSANEISFIQLTSVVSIRIDSCTFTALGANSSVLVAAESPDIKLVYTSFSAPGLVGILTNSLVMVTFCCFQGDPASVSGRFLADGTSLVHVGDAVEFRSECPWVEFTATLSAEQKAYAIATVVIFFFCFAVLFVGLIVFVFCKARKEELDYAEIQQDPGVMDEGDIDIPSS